MHTDPAVSKDMNGAPPHEIRLSRETAGGCEATVPYEWGLRAGVISERNVKNM